MSDITELKKIIESIHDELMEYPAFDEMAYKYEDMEAICDEGGDCAFVTLLALQVRDALKIIDQLSTP